ncbi:MAG: 2-hydroxyacyl-CoA dehydratase [Desulfobacterales bacterium]|nr:2-hydroxyacyl-CoA dehydratase [Desulfobacterales bacterium]
MMYEYFKNLESSLEKKINETPKSPNARKKYSLEVARIGKRLYSGKDKIAWTGIGVPFDILNTMGITSCFVEFVGAMLASTGASGNFIKEAENTGYASDSCSYHRAILGALSQNLIPKPDFLVGTTLPCSGGLAVIENMARKFKKSLFVLNVPQEDSLQNIKYLSDQLKDLVNFIQKETGINFDENKLKEGIKKTNKARDLMIEAYNLAKKIPSPVDSRILKDFGIVTALMLGTDAGIEVAKAYRDEFQAKVNSGESGVKGEKIRLLWIQNRIQFRYQLEKWMEEEFSASIVIDELNDITWEKIDVDDPFTGIAKRIISIPFNGKAEKRIEHLKFLAKEYKIQGAINPCNWGCRQGTGERGLISDGLKEIGVPVVNLEIDCIDQRNFAEGQVKTRIAAFIEMISN